ncbi:Nitroreductase family protein [Roseibacterium elongatum DSM 19469]|uniref:Putative NAD(P)H nitroreductase n=1 Tax=Roseicyclus elongatus DSM 19469 TaxID=1294273 RepID=W8RXJ8_9RHOB|nr:nitroreductase [Roseibacterium elongatum]AHM02537.1 Nitroreductase family protein [Roseibacterium elongatum DSM 19469]
MPNDHDTSPLRPRPEALAFLRTRRSRPPRMLGTETPDRDKLRAMLSAASRVPDHGKLEPWRFVVLGPKACTRLAALTESLGAARGLGPEKLAKDISGFNEARLIVAVVYSPRPTDRIPRDEQLMSAAAVCLSLVNAALASGWGACWLTGWRATDPAFLTQGLGLFPGEIVAGFIHIGNELRVPPDRPRPDLDAVTSWMDE